MLSEFRPRPERAPAAASQAAGEASEFRLSSGTRTRSCDPRCLQCYLGAHHRPADQHNGCGFVRCLFVLRVSNVGRTGGIDPLVFASRGPASLFHGLLGWKPFRAGNRHIAMRRSIRRSSNSAESSDESSGRSCRLPRRPSHRQTTSFDDVAAA